MPSRSTHSPFLSCLVAPRGPFGEELCITLAIVRSPDDDEEPAQPSAVFLHTSGLHGVEGYAGSAIQIKMLQEWDSLGPKLSAGQLLVVAHAVNPFGMAWRSRFDQGNRDLNRNGLNVRGTAEEDSARFAALKAEGNPDYDTFSDVINPTTIGCCDCFPLRAACLLAVHGMDRMKRATATGQYDNAAGIFFGGFSLAESYTSLLQTLVALGVNRENPNLTRFAHVDVHTGLGQPGVASLLAPAGQPVGLIRSIAGVAGEARRTQDGTALLVQGNSTAGVAYPMQGTLVCAVASLLGPQHPALFSGLTPGTEGVDGWEEWVRAEAAAAEPTQAPLEGVPGAPSGAASTPPAEDAEGKADPPQASPVDDSDVTPVMPNPGDAAAAAPGGSDASPPAAVEPPSAGQAKTHESSPARHVEGAPTPPPGTPAVKLFFAQEFGTVPPAEVVQALRALNCVTRGTQEPLPITAPERTAVFKAFFVSTPEWKEAILRQGVQAFQQFATATFSHTGEEGLAKLATAMQAADAQDAGPEGSS